MGQNIRTQNAEDKQAPVGKAASGLKAYLTDWRNLLGHALLGIIFLVIAIWAPIDWWIKIIIIVILISFNIWRMRRKHRN